MHAFVIHTYNYPFPFFFFFFFLISYLVFTFCFLFACVTISSQKVYACNLYFFFSIGIGYYCTTNDFFIHIPLFHFITFPLLILSVSKKFCTYLRVYFSHTFFLVVFHLFDDILSIFYEHFKQTNQRHHRVNTRDLVESG